MGKTIKKIKIIKNFDKEDYTFVSDNILTTVKYKK